MKIIDLHYPNIKQDMLVEALQVFFDLRNVEGLKKQPSTSELIDWLKLLIADDLAQEVLINKTSNIIPLLGALLKSEQDTSLLEKLALMSHRQSR